jgi:hypothetical protein
VVITDPNTDIIPFIPHIQGMLWLDSSSRVRNPEGKGIPMKNPSGMSKIIEIIILIEESYGKKVANKVGSNKR